MDKYCLLDSRDGWQRYGIVSHGVIVSVQVSKPDGECVPSPQRFARRTDTTSAVRYINAQTFTIKSGEQPRRPTWRRAGRTAAKQ